MTVFFKFVSNSLENNNFCPDYPPCFFEPFTDVNGNGVWDDSESFIDIGNDMILNYSLVLNILAVVLGVSIIGALTMAKLDKGDKK